MTGKPADIPFEKGDMFPENEQADAKAPAFLLQPTFDIEQALIRQGYRVIAGIDEAGRGALAGPLSIGIVIYGSEFIRSGPDRVLEKIRDSKKLSPARRNFFSSHIREKSILSETLFASPRIIDELNVNGATKYLIRKFLEKTGIRPDILIIDGNFSFTFDVPVLPLCKGDSRSITIASASVLAKVKRDRVMERLDARFQGYGLSVNKGYGTRIHMEAIRSLGYSRIHRKSYEPVKSMIHSTGSPAL